MRYYLDTEFNGMGGELISLALVSEQPIGEIYLANAAVEKQAIWSKSSEFKSPGVDPWVWKNVLPIIAAEGSVPHWIPLSDFGTQIEHLLANDPDPIIVTDWPDDIRYLCQCLITGPGQMINISGLKFEMHRVDAYPTTLEGAIQHNAYWDALALRHKLQEAQT